MLKLTIFEQNCFNQEMIGTITTTISPMDKLLLFKVLSIAIDKAIPNNKFQFSKMSEQVLKNGEVVDLCLQDILVFLSDYASE
ncbi:hypothetical protein [Bacillus sp. S0628]|uniref:hypothetical protein n=1 Tax=Bacillus sp. S0628 TaxID=2957802 RepID=UPI00209C9585|nr:hypothetical protein [Bacillus sp. S0628]MCP1322065.1 hypothetical protein [Bacillus sp. S0628]